MAAGIHQLLAPVLLTKVVSRVAKQSQAVLTWMGMNPGGKNEESLGHGREGAYHTYDHVRKIAAGRAPGTAAARRGRNPMGKVPFVYPRMHDSVSLLAEEVHNLAKIEDPKTRDEAGKSYIRLQTESIGEAAANWRLAMVVGMLKDSLYIVPESDGYYFTWSSGSGFQVPFQVPSGNKSRLDMLGDGNIISASWATTSTNIPKHWAQIQAAQQRLNGGRFTDVICSSVFWQNLLNNDYIQAQHGTSNPPYKEWTYEFGADDEGVELSEQRGSLLSMPGVTFHITDGGLDLGARGSETFTRIVPDTHAIFMQSPKRNIYKMYLGSEPIAEYDGGPESVKTGLASWSTKTANPTTTNIFVLDNAFPVPYVPSSIAYAECVF